MPDEVCKPHALGQTLPNEGGRTADTVGNWDSFPGQIKTSWSSLDLNYFA